MLDLGCPNAGSSQLYVVSGGRCVMTSNPPRHGHVLREYEFDPESPEAFPWLFEMLQQPSPDDLRPNVDADNREGSRSIYARGNSKQERGSDLSSSWHSRNRFTNDAQGLHQDGQ